jgi:hypothetical protein
VSLTTQRLNAKIADRVLSSQTMTPTSGDTRTPILGLMPIFDFSPYY